MRSKKLWLPVLALLVAGGMYTLFHGGDNHDANGGDGAHASTAEEYERGPHRGRMIRKDNFALEVTIFENGVPPEYHVYAYENDKPLDPTKVTLTIVLNRLDSEVNTFNFTSQDDFLKGDGVITEPHSFDVSVQSTYNGKNYNWKFASYEGRTKIEAAAAKAAGIAIAKAGPAIIKEIASLTGRIVLNGNSTANIKARFPGVIRSVKKIQGESVNAGDVMMTVESNDSLQVYSITSPIKGVVISRNANIGDVTGDTTVFIVANVSDVWAEFHVFSDGVAHIQKGQKVIVEDIKNVINGEGVITTLLPLMKTSTQTTVARVLLDNSKGLWRPGMIVQGKTIVKESKAPLAVKSSGLQTFRDFSVVFAQVGTTYEVRMLELGLNDGEYVEVLGGIKPDTSYVSENSFLIKADIEKSGASHDH
jgi:cobalt-zinc-cadmium efflux system membrane fusion protein